MEIDRSKAASMGRPLAIHLAVAGLRALEDYRALLGTVDRISTVAAIAALTHPAADATKADGLSIRRIAACLGEDKETIRRRVLHLVADRVLIRDQSGRIGLNREYFCEPASMAVIRRRAVSVAKLTNTFCSGGVIAGYQPGCSTCLAPTATMSADMAWESALVLLGSTHRSLAAYREVTGSTDQVLVVLAVIAITSQHLTRTNLPSGLEDLRVPIPRERLGVCNVSSIAAAAGLPFETTRRKIAELIEQGSLVKDGAGNVQFAPGKLQQLTVYALITRNAIEAVDLAGRLEDIGVLARTDAARCNTE